MSVIYLLFDMFVKQHVVQQQKSISDAMLQHKLLFTLCHYLIM